MSKTTHALDILDGAALPKNNIYVLFGDESFFRRQIFSRIKQQYLSDDDDGASYRLFDGQTAAWRDLNDELSTVSLFNAGGMRLVALENVEAFLKEYRDRLEAYCEQPSRSSVLVLFADSWPSNTRLYKKLDKSGGQIDCRLPHVGSRGSKVDTKRIARWIESWGKNAYELQVSAPAATRMLDLVGPEMGLIDQELAKLSVFIHPVRPIEPEDIDRVVGGWRCETVWEAIDAALDGQPAHGLQMLDHLLHAGEHPLALMGQISWSLRRFAVAAAEYQLAERKGAPIKLDEALQRGGFRLWNQHDKQHAIGQLKRIGRERCLLIPQWLLQVDLALKGTHAHKDRARYILEELFLKLSLPAEQIKASHSTLTAP